MSATRAQSAYACEGKQRLTLARAKEIAHSSQKGDDPMTWYRCACGYFHVGHVVRKRPITKGKRA